MSRASQIGRVASTLHAFSSALYRAYGPQHWWPARTRFEVIVGAYLTQATAWASVERSIANLRRAGCLNLDGLRRTPVSQLQALIRPSGFVRRKAASLRAFVDFLDAQHGGSLTRLSRQDVLRTRRQLLALPGVGPETADVILVYALGHPAIVIDTYLRRVAHRHGLIPAAAERYDPELRAAAEQMLSAPALEPVLARAQEFHAWIVEVGKRHCRATAQCEGCPLQKFLPRASVQMKRLHHSNT